MSMEHHRDGPQCAKKLISLSSRPHRSLDDEQLDSGDDENRYDRRDDRMDEAADEDGYPETVNIMDVGLARAPVPATNDGQVRRKNCPGKKHYY